MPERLQSGIFVQELQTTCRAQYRAAAVDNAADIASPKRSARACDQAREAMPETDDLAVATDRGTCHGSNRRIHAGGITAARQHADSLHSEVGPSGSSPRACRNREEVTES